MEVQDHVTCVILDSVVWVGCRIIEEPNCCVMGCLSCFCLPGCDGANVN